MCNTEKVFNHPYGIFQLACKGAALAMVFLFCDKAIKSSLSDG